MICKKCKREKDSGYLQKNELICYECNQQIEKGITEEMEKGWDNYHRMESLIPQKIRQIYEKKFIHFTDLSFIDDLIEDILDFSVTELKQLIMYILLENVSLDT